MLRLQSVALVSRLLVGLASVALVLQVPTTVGGAEGPREPVDVRVLPVARLVDGGPSMAVRVRVVCQPVGSVLEALAHASQDEAFAEGFLDVVCDGRARVQRVVFTPFDDASFDRGQATVDAFVLLEVDPTTGDTVQGDDVRVVRVVGGERATRR